MRKENQISLTLTTSLFQIGILNQEPNGWSVWSPKFLDEKLPGFYETKIKALEEATDKSVESLVECIKTVTYEKYKTYEGMVEAPLKPNQVFVFGANTEGRHGAGAAKFALNHCGAKYGNPSGPQGQSYAIITKDLTKKVHPSISEEEIISQIKILYSYAAAFPEKEFLVAYSAGGTNLNAYSTQQMVDMFGKHFTPPANIVFEKEFFELMKPHILNNVLRKFI
jgi:hypothetical protein